MGYNDWFLSFLRHKDNNNIYPSKEVPSDQHHQSTSKKWNVHQEGTMPAWGHAIISRVHHLLSQIHCSNTKHPRFDGWRKFTSSIQSYPQTQCSSTRLQRPPSGVLHHHGRGIEMPYNALEKHQLSLKESWLHL